AMNEQRAKAGANGAHRFETSGGWGSMRASVAAYRCRACGLIYFMINYTDDPAGRLIPVGADGEETSVERLERHCCAKEPG
ncbi:MAG: hypothetical protein ACREH9_11400, partial [Pseudomonadota bacterium]